MHEELELARELDQALRTAVTTIAQITERTARTRADRRHEAAQRDRNTARETASQARDLQRQQAAQNRAVWTAQRDGARDKFLPWTRPGVVERGDRVAASRAWAAAAAWAEQDPRALAARDDLGHRIHAAHGADPATILRSIETPAAPGRVPAGRITMPEAVALAETNAPFYYHRHTRLRGRLDTRPNGAAQQQVWADWQHWAEHGRLPTLSRWEAWAAHTGRGAEFAPGRWRTTGGAVDEHARAAALHRHWDTTATDRADAELDHHRTQMRAAGLDPNRADLAIGTSLTPAGRPDRPLDPATLGDATVADLVRTWESARIAALLEPENAAVALDNADLLERHFRDRFGVDPATYLADALHDLHTADDQDRDQDAVAAALSEDTEIAHENAASTGAPTEIQYRNVEVPAGHDNPDRGVAPTKAGSDAERAHRTQTWRLAQAGIDETAWRQLPSTDRYDRYWSVYDTEQARQVQIPDNGTLGPADPLTGTSEDSAKTPPPERSASSPAVDNQAPAASSAQPAAVPKEERGMAPSKAPTPQERARRATAWTLAEKSFRAELPAGTPSMAAGTAWQDMEWQDKALRYWSAYDSAEARQAAGLAPVANHAAARPRAAGPAAAAAAATPAISRERTLELNTLAADYFAASMTPDSPGHAYLTGRLGADVMAEDHWCFGYAPAGWTNLTGHLRGHGATDTEIVAAGLGVISSRNQVIDVFRDRAIMGIRDQDGEVVGFIGRDLSGDERAPKYLNTASTPAFTKGDHLFGLYEALPGARLVRVEGPFDAVAVTAAGNGQIAGVAPLGTALTDRQADQLAAHGRVWEMLDGDLAGRRAAEKDFWLLAERGADVRHLPLPDRLDPATLWEDNRDRLRATLTDPDNARSAAFLVLDNTVDELRPRLLAGDDDASAEIGFTEYRLRHHTPEDQRDQLLTHSYDTIAQLHHDAGQEAAEQAIQERHATEHRDTPTAPTTDAAAADDPRDPTINTVDGQNPAPSAPAAHYDRAGTVPATIDADARQARQVSAHGYPRPTRDMLTGTDPRQATQAKPRPQTPAPGRATHIRPQVPHG